MVMQITIKILQHKLMAILIFSHINGNLMHMKWYMKWYILAKVAMCFFQKVYISTELNAKCLNVYYLKKVSEYKSQRSKVRPYRRYIFL